MLNCGWYADEEVCRRASVPGWVKRQRRIAKKLDGLEWRGGYFNHEMLRRRFAVGFGLRGLDPDREYEPQLERWLAGHTGRKPVSEERRVELAAMLQKNIASGLAISSRKGAVSAGFEG